MNKEQKNKLIAKANVVNKLNNISAILIVVLYIVVVAVISTLISRDPIYKVSEDAKPTFGEEVNFSTVIFNKITLDTSSEDAKTTSKYYIYTLNDAKGDKKLSNVSYDLTVETTEENYVYFDRMLVAAPFSTSTTYESSKRNTITVADSTYSDGKKTTYSYNNSLLTAEGVAKLFGQVKYKHTVEGVEKEENYAYSREVLTLSKKEMEKATKDNALVDLFEIQFYLSAKQKDYNNYVVGVKNLDLKVNYKLDLQSFVETKDGEVLPLCGVYNYADDDKEFVSTNKFLSSENQIYKNVEVKNVYVKVRIYSSLKDFQEVVVKYDYATLCA